MIEKNFFKITPYESLLVAEFYGSWDITVTREYLEEALKIIRQHYSKQPYAVLDDCRNWELNTPDAVKFWKETYANGDIHFPTHVAYVVGNSELKSWVIENMISSAVSFKGAVFNDLTEAAGWLESHGYKMPHSYAGI